MITGAYVEGNNAFQAFVRLPDSRLWSFNNPAAGTGAGQGSGAANINDIGTILGGYGDSSSISHAYLLTPFGRFINFDAPDAGTAPGQGTEVPTLVGMLGVQPLLGRTYSEQEDKPGTHVAVLGYGLWQDRYAGRLNIVGQTIELDRIPYTVIGVMPKDFQFPLHWPKYNNEPAELWVPWPSLQTNWKAGASTTIACSRD